MCDLFLPPSIKELIRFIELFFFHASQYAISFRFTSTKMRTSPNNFFEAQVKNFIYHVEGMFCSQDTQFFIFLHPVILKSVTL